MESDELEHQPLIEESEEEPVHHKLNKRCCEKVTKILCCCFAKCRRSLDLNKNEISAYRAYQRQFGGNFKENINSHIQSLEDLKNLLLRIKTGSSDTNNFWKDFGFQVI